MIKMHRIVFAAVFGGLIVAAAPLLAQPGGQGGPVAPTDAQVRELEQKVNSLSRQLDELGATRDATTRQRLMQQNWRSMQDYVGQMHDRWGMGYPWMTGRPWAMCGPGMMGGGSTAWPVPPGVTPEQYGQQMRDHMQRMQEQIGKIAQTTDPQERQRLMQEHWEGMYRDMQTMRGMGWMWGGGTMMGPGMMMGPGIMHGGPPPSAAALPEAESPGAKLVSVYCTQCHAAPQPSLHSATEWSGVTQRMHLRMQSGWQGIKTPTEQEMTTIVAFMQKYARN